MLIYPSPKDQTDVREEVPRVRTRLPIRTTTPVYQTTFDEAMNQVLAANPNMKLTSKIETEYEVGAGEKAMQDVLAKWEC